MRTDEIRERFLAFFQRQGHTVYPSDSLVPANDPSLLFTGAGMNQFKDMFLGRGSLPFKRATTSQKCLRTGDLENVGRTAAHHTFFEMLGHFSFGDYFKAEAIPWTWEFYTRELAIPVERLFVSIYKDDEEAFKIWTGKVGLPPSKISRFGESDNFWPANAPSQGPNGPCGPCSELFYDFGESFHTLPTPCGVACNCGRFVEIGNIVFTQFDRQEGGRLDPLPQKNIDFGGGLERVTAVVQGVHSNFDTDLFRPLLAAARQLLKLPEGGTKETLTRLRRISDHVRALVFCIADNAMPSNDGRGYVVRRILRTALRDGIKLGHDAAFLHQMVPTVLDVMKKPYPYLVERRTTIEGIIKSEEEAFLQTVHRGTAILEEKIAALKKSGAKSLPGDTAFQLYDTFGFPIEITEDVVREHGFQVDRNAFDAIMKGKSEGTVAATSDDIFGKGAFGDIKNEKEPLTTFLGYQIPMADLGKGVEASVRRIIRLQPEALQRFASSKQDTAAVTLLLNSGELVSEAPAGTEVAVLLDKTPFYGESGGQAGDAGCLDASDALVEIRDTRRPDGYFFHFGTVATAPLRTGTPVICRIDAFRRLDIMLHHTGTHLLQAALRAVLGTHVEQAGSVVEPERLRFDFTHFQAMTREDIRAVEDYCNRYILQDLAIDKQEVSMDEAKKRGAIAFFGEKYGDRVRVVTVGDGVSVELCGGTHLERTGVIGQLKIVSESGIQRGVRRIEAVAGLRAVEHARKQYDQIDAEAQALGCPREEVPKKIAQLQKTVQELKQEVARLKKSGGGTSEIDELISSAQEAGGERFVIGRFSDRKVDDLRNLLDELLKKRKLGAALLASLAGEKPAFIIGVREDLAGRRLKAGDIAKEIGKRCGGGGGGRDQMAQAGASDASKVDEALALFRELVEAALRKS